jgi:protocatechuate 3,4-dioxygenase alpha subunit
MTLIPTASQTVGPFYAIGLKYLASASIPARVAGETVTVTGRILDGAGTPVPDAFLEIWQADSSGDYTIRHEVADGESPLRFPGFGRVTVDDLGEFEFSTVKPGRVPYDKDRDQAPHLLVLIFMRGLLRNLVTRMYFPGEESNASDPILQLIPEGRRGTFIANPDGANRLRWEIRLRGELETVFFAW